MTTLRGNEGSRNLGVDKFQNAFHLQNKFYNTRLGTNSALFVVVISVKKSRYWNAGGNALNVETAGYVLLTQVILGRTGYAGPIVTYLTNQRQGGVGFVSTQVCN